KVLYKGRFQDQRPYEREFSGIQKFEPLSRTHPGLVNILQIGRNDKEGYFYYVMELADDCERPESEYRVSKTVGNGPNGVAGGAGEPGSSMDGKLSRIRLYRPHTLRAASERGRLSFGECLQLGLDLTAALAHLHKNGLVHRDIKPSNIIFVNGVPKL